MLDVVILGATEVDTDFNANVNTEADGALLHGTGGHQDTAAGGEAHDNSSAAAPRTHPLRHRQGLQRHDPRRGNRCHRHRIRHNDQPAPQRPARRRQRSQGPPRRHDGRARRARQKNVRPHRPSSHHRQNSRRSGMARRHRDRRRKTAEKITQPNKRSITQKQAPRKGRFCLCSAVCFTS